MQASFQDFPLLYQPLFTPAPPPLPDFPNPAPQCPNFQSSVRSGYIPPCYTTPATQFSWLRLPCCRRSFSFEDKLFYLHSQTLSSSSPLSLNCSHPPRFLLSTKKRNSKTTTLLLSYELDPQRIKRSSFILLHYQSKCQALAWVSHTQDGIYCLFLLPSSLC